MLTPHSLGVTLRLFLWELRMPIEITCPCGSAYRLGDDRAGEQFVCKVCGATMTIPAGTPRAAIGEPQPAPVPAAVQASESAPGSAATTPAPPAQGPAHSDPWSGSGESLDGIRHVPGVSRAATRSSVGGVATTSAPAATAGAALPYGERRASLRPPAEWWAVRATMMGLCLGFFFMPWFSSSFQLIPGTEAVTTSVSGWGIVSELCQNLSNPSISTSFAPSGTTRPSPSGSMPAGASAAFVGGIMLVFGPVVFVLGMLLSIIFAYVAYRRDGKSAHWPFVACMVGVGGFLLGWHLLTSYEPVKKVLAVASSMGAKFGPTVWTYLMIVLLIPMVIIARGQPYRSFTAAYSDQI
jgi:hypothetical protein